MVLNILFVTRKMILLDQYELSCLKWVDTSNILKAVEKACLLWLQMTMHWLNIIIFGTKLKRH